MTFSQQWIQFHNWIHMGPFAWSLVVNRGSYRRRLSSVRYGLGLVSANEFSNLVTIHTCCSFKRRMSCKPSTNEHSIRFSLLSNYCQLGLKWFWCIACQLEWRGRVCMDYTMSWTFRALAFWIWFGKSFFRSVEWVGGVQNETPFQNEKAQTPICLIREVIFSVNRVGGWGSKRNTRSKRIILEIWGFQPLACFTEWAHKIHLSSRNPFGSQMGNSYYSHRVFEKLMFRVIQSQTQFMFKVVLPTCNGARCRKLNYILINRYP